MELLQPIKISAREENKNVCTHKNIYLRWRKKKYDSRNIELRMKGSKKKADTKPNSYSTIYSTKYMVEFGGNIKFQ